MGKDARTFGQDLMRGEHVVGEGRYDKETAKARQAAGTTMPAATSHPRFYEHKVAKEKEIGRQLSTAEFEAEYWSPPEDSPMTSGTSIFDPVLCEIAYRWFSPPGGVVLDPFAGGSVRGIVASKLGRQYVGVDLSQRQIEANRAQLGIAGDPAPVWHHGDSLHIDKIAKGVTADFLFSCPPYADLEVYSDDPADISAMDYPDFRAAYFEIIAKACAMLKPDRFACFVVGDVRDKAGLYYGLPEDTVAAFGQAGLRKYNEAVLVTAVGSLPIRAGRQFETTRKLGKTHQNVLIFVKGDPKKATQNIGPVEFGAFEDAEGGGDGGEGNQDWRADFG